MDTLINDFTQALIPIVITLVTGLVALLLNQAREYAIRRVGAEQTRLIEGVLAQAVKAAKQTLASAPGKEKKKAALAHAQLALDQLSIKVNVALLDSWIEAALYDVNTSEKENADWFADMNREKVSPPEKPASITPVATSYSVGTTATGTGSTHTE